MREIAPAVLSDLGAEREDGGSPRSNAFLGAKGSVDGSGRHEVTGAEGGVQGL